VRDYAGIVKRNIERIGDLNSMSKKSVFEFMKVTTKNIRRK